MNFKTFKKIISVLPSNANKLYHDVSFSPLVVADSKILVCDGIVIVSCIEPTETNTRISISPENFSILLNSNGENVYFKDRLYIDDTSFDNADNFMIYEESDRLFKDAKEKNIYTMPMLKLENIKCKSVSINQYGVHYADDDNKILKSTPFNSPKISDTPKGYISFQYKYLYSVLEMFKRLNILPVIKFGSGTNVMFESPTIECILMQYNIPVNFKYIKCEDDEQDW